MMRFIRLARDMAAPDRAKARQPQITQMSSQAHKALSQLQNRAVQGIVGYSYAKICNGGTSSG